MGNWNTYIAAQAMHDNGWWKSSPATLGRFYGDIGWRDDKAEFHVFSSLASTSFRVAAATPIELLNQNWSSIYTTPQTTRTMAWSASTATTSYRHVVAAGQSVHAAVHRSYATMGELVAA